LVTFQQVGGGLGVGIIGVVFFGILAGHGPGVSGAIAPELEQRLATTSVAASEATTVAAFRACADDHARSHDPAISPASCGRPELHSSDPAVTSLIAAFLQRANARNYANAFVIAMLCATGGMIVALVSAFRLPAPRGSTGS
ncbi:MAG: hypothetical protein M3008_02210, partial [Chloroflexota bacterium]|nr:hypothetical protein [Chloroflexota bacterium]